MDENSIENIEVKDNPDGSANVTMDITPEAQSLLMKQGLQYLIDEMKMTDKVMVMEPNEFSSEAKTWDMNDEEYNALFHFGFLHALKLGMEETEKFEEDGWIDNKTPPVNLEFSQSEVDKIIECIKTNATLMADVKEELLVKIRSA